MNWLVLVLGVACNALASVLVKVAAMPPRSRLSLEHPLQALTNLPLVAGVASYGVAFLLYAIAVGRLPLNVAHPVLTCGAVAVVAISSVLVFHEPFPVTRVVGIGCVLLGVALISMSAA